MANGLPIFFGEAEEKLFTGYGRELVENLINQHIVLYSVSLKNTESDFYGEAKHKYYDKLTELQGRIHIEDVDIYSEGGIRRVAKGDMTCWIYNQHLEENEVQPRVGDFIGFLGKFYEVFDAGVEKDSMDRKYAADRDYFTEVLAKVVTEDIFKSIEGQFK